MKEMEIYGGNKGRQGSKNMKECKRVEAKDKKYKQGVQQKDGGTCIDYKLTETKGNIYTLIQKSGQVNKKTNQAGVDSHQGGRRPKTGHEDRGQENH